MSNPTDFDTRLASFLAELGSVLPPSAAQLLTERIHRIHAERPDLDIPEVVEIARGVIQGNQQDTLRSLEAAEAERAEAVAAAERSRAELDSLVRIQAAFPELERLESLFPGRATAAEMLADAGRTWDDFGLTDADGALFQRLLAEHTAS